MGVYDSIRAYKGVVIWIKKQKDIDLGKPRKKTRRAHDEHFNNILIEFGKEHNIAMAPNNSPGYKGSYSPVMSNCKKVQENFSLFTKWIKKNYKKQ